MTRPRKLRNVRDRQWIRYLKYLARLRERAGTFIITPTAWDKRFRRVAGRRFK